MTDFCPDRQITPHDPEQTQSGYTKCRNCGEVYFDGKPVKVQTDPQDWEWVECCKMNNSTCVNFSAVKLVQILN